MDFIPAKQIMSGWSSGDRWFGKNYGINIYKGCCHGCIYCDSRSACYQIENFDEVRGKENALAIIESELKSKRRKGIVSTGAMSDPYNPFERKYKLTRGSLELINKYGFGITLHTKSDLVLRDLDLLVKIKEHSPSMVILTITTYDDALCRKLEPNVSLTSKRFEALRQLSKAGIFTGIFLWPILPFINDTEENIKLIVKEAAECGVDFIAPYFGVTLRLNQREYFYNQLDRMFPGVKQKYIETFGNSYECVSPNSKRLWQVFTSECKRYGILYKMEEIVAAARCEYENTQMTLF